MEFDIPRVKISGVANYDRRHRMVRSRLDFPLYVEERHFAGYSPREEN